MPADVNGDLESLIMAQLQEGRCADACRTAITHYRAEVHGYFNGMLRDPGVADDLFQDWCLALMDALPRFAARSSLRTYLYSIARHQILQRKRRYSQRHVIRLDTGADEALAKRSPESPSANVRARELTRRFEQLSDDDREILILRTEREMTVTELAAVLGVSREAAKMRFRRARQRLQELIDQDL